MAFRVALTYAGFHMGCPDLHKGLRVALTFTPVSNRGFWEMSWLTQESNRVSGLSWLAQGIYWLFWLTPVSNRGFLRNVLTYAGIKQGFRVVLTYTRDQELSWLTPASNSFYYYRNVPTYTRIKQGFMVVLTYTRDQELSWLMQTSVKQGFSEKCPDLCQDQTGFQGCPDLHQCQTGFSPEKCPDLHRDQTGLSWLAPVSNSFFSPEKCPDLHRDQTWFQSCPDLHQCQTGFFWGMSWLIQGSNRVSGLSWLTPVSNRVFLRNVPTYTGIKRFFSEECPDLYRDQTGVFWGMSWLTQGSNRVSGLSSSAVWLLSMGSVLVKITELPTAPNMAIWWDDTSPASRLSWTADPVS